MTDATGHIGIGAESQVHRRGRHRQDVSVPRLHLWHRALDRYPDTWPRFMYLGIVVLATITLYYEFYVPGAVSPSIMRHYGMTFPFFVYVLVIANLAGAFASLVAGLADRWGRANMVAY